MSIRWVAGASVAGLLAAGCGGAAKTHSSASTPTPAAKPPVPVSGVAATGKAVFLNTGCGHCHTLAAAGSTGVLGPDLDTRLRPDCATPASKRIRGATIQDCIYAAITNPYVYLPAGYHAGIMPPGYGTGLSSKQLHALVAFLSSAAK